MNILAVQFFQEIFAQRQAQALHVGRQPERHGGIILLPAVDTGCRAADILQYILPGEALADPIEIPVRVKRRQGGQHRYAAPRAHQGYDRSQRLFKQSGRGLWEVLAFRGRRHRRPIHIAVVAAVLNEHKRFIHRGAVPAEFRKAFRRGAAHAGMVDNRHLQLLLYQARRVIAQNSIAFACFIKEYAFQHRIAPDLNGCNIHSTHHLT